MRMPDAPIEYFKRFYADTANFGNPIALRAALEFFGPEHVLFGTDFGFSPDFAPATVDDVEAVIADEAIKRAVYEGNARRVLRVDRRNPQDMPWSLRSRKAAAAPMLCVMRNQPETVKQCMRELSAAIARSERGSPAWNEGARRARAALSHARLARLLLPATQSQRGRGTGGPRGDRVALARPGRSHEA